MNPSDEGLRTNNRSIPIHNCLKIRLDLPFPDRTMELRGNLLFPQCLPAHVVVIVSNMFRVLPADQSQCHMCPVKHDGNANIPFFNFINTKMDQDRMRYCPFLDHEVFQTGLKDLLIKRILRHTDAKRVTG